MSAILEVKWNGKRFPVEFRNAKELERTTVKDLKSICQRITGVDPETMKINAFGALMNNNDLPLSVYGLRPGCFVTMKVGHKDKETLKKTASKEEHQHQQQQQQQQQQQHETNKQNHHHHHPSKHAPSNNHRRPMHDNQQQDAGISREEVELLGKLQQIRTKLETEITPQVKKYETDVKEFINSSYPTEKEKKAHFYMGAYLGEQLMHVFFDLDAFTCGPNNLKARQARKEAVTLTQSLLDKVDEIKSVVKSVEVGQEDES